nr:helix-turn-helix domain-containing protein [Xanthomonas albilineans]
MGKQYRHMSFEERALLQIELGNVESIRSIARRLGRSTSTLSREVIRQNEPVYTASLAAKPYRQCPSPCVGGLYAADEEVPSFSAW